MNTQTPKQRAIARQNLLTTALGVAFERKLISCKRTTFEFEIAGLSAIGCVHADRDEISIRRVTVDPTELGRRFACCLISHKRPLFGAACAAGWLCRRSGKFVSVTGDFHASNTIAPVLAGLRIAKAAPRQAAHHLAEARS